MCHGFQSYNHQASQSSSCVENVQEDMSRSQIVLIKWFQTHKAPWLKCSLWPTLTKSGYCSLQVSLLVLFCRSKCCGLSTQGALQSIQTLLHIEKCSIQRSLGLLGNQKFQAFWGWEVQGAKPWARVLKPQLRYTRCAKHFIWGEKKIGSADRQQIVAITQLLLGRLPASSSGTSVSWT